MFSQTPHADTTTQIASLSAKARRGASETKAICGEPRRGMEWTSEAENNRITESVHSSTEKPNEITCTYPNGFQRLLEK
eukprot:4548517-Amphidinium_carterae.1